MRPLTAGLVAAAVFVTGCLTCDVLFPLPGEYLAKYAPGILADVTSIEMAADLMVLHLEFDDGTVGTVIYRVRRADESGSGKAVDSEAWDSDVRDSSAEETGAE